MASGATVKLGVEGISQFKNNMNQAKQAVKTLDAQLTLSEKQFKQTGDAESYMTEKTELLKAKLEQQKEILTNAEKALQDMAAKGIDKASKSYQDMYRQMITAKGGLIDTQAEMDNLNASCGESSNGVSELKNQLNNIGSQVSFKNITEKIDGLTGKMAAAAKRALQIGKNLIRSSMDSASYADDLLTRAAKYGADYDAELVQKMDNVAAYIDTDTDAIINAQKRLRKAMGAEDSKETMGAFAALGIDPNNMDWQDAFWKAGEALRTLQDDVAREEYATKLFGRSWDELNPLFEAGRQKYEQMLSEQTVLTNAQVEALGKEDDAMQKMQQQIDLLKNQFWAGLAPAITDATNAMSGLLEQFNIYLQSDEGQQMLTKMGEAVSGLFEDLSKIDPQEVISGFSGVFNAITEGFQWICDHKQDIIASLEGIVIGWGALKLTGGALKLWELVTGIKGLHGVNGLPGVGSNGAAGGGAVTGSPATPWYSTILKKALPVGIGAGLVISDSLNNHGDENQWSAEEIERIKKLNEQGSNGPTFDMTWGGIGDRLKTAGDWTFDDNMTAEELMTMVRAAEDLTGASETTRKSSSEMTEAAGTMKGLPGTIENAILRGMSQIRIYIDGQQAGAALTPSINSILGGIVNGVTGVIGK